MSNDKCLNCDGTGLGCTGVCPQCKGTGLIYTGDIEDDPRQCEKFIKIPKNEGGKKATS